MNWQPIETAPKDGTRVDLWIVADDGAWREADAYYVTERVDMRRVYWEDGKMSTTRTIRDGWFAPNHDHDGEDGWCDEPRWFNAHPRQRKWKFRTPTHWMPLPGPPSPEA